MTPPAEGCARSISRPSRAGAPLARATTDPVVCGGCGSRFGRGAEAGTVCPVCGGELQPLSRRGGMLADDPGPRDGKEREG
jgi:predicted amidophosphoribosyltransferase